MFLNEDSAIHTEDIERLDDIPKMEASTQGLHCNGTILTKQHVMTTHLLKHSDLRGLLVIDEHTTEELGYVNQLFVDIQSHQVIGGACVSGFLGRTIYDFRWTDINEIEADRILIHWRGDTLLETSTVVDAMIGLEMQTDQGLVVGVISDYCLDPRTGKIIDYAFVADVWRGIQEGSYCFPSHTVVSARHQRLIVKDEAAQAAKPFSEGLQDNLTQLVGAIKENCTQVQADMTFLVEGS
ncbi:MAG: hypothetical protein F6J95_030635 [Leptolyngbya sp. SIO1E4]|nr:hypothetical protein [Leptolyngbya sp. SIO1E4]